MTIMDIKSSSSPIARPSSPSPTSTISLLGLDFSQLPPVAILSAHLNKDEEKNLRQNLEKHHAPLTSDLTQAKVFIGKVSTKRRAEFELRSRKFIVQDVTTFFKRPASSSEGVESASKKRKLSQVAVVALSSGDEESTTEDEVIEISETDDEANEPQRSPVHSTASLEEDLPPESVFYNNGQNDLVWVIRMDWIKACRSAGHLVSLADHLVYKAEVVERPKSIPTTVSIKSIFAAAAKTTPHSKTVFATRPHTAQEILQRAQSDVPASGSKSAYQPHLAGKSHGSRRFEGRTFASSSKSSRHTQLMQRTTTGEDSEDNDLPRPPDWVTKGVKYACQRFTPANGPNEDFLEQLRKIRTARTLIDDRIGIRAYSTIIAAIAAYPYKLTHPREIARIPGCDEKTKSLFVEWKNTGKIQAVEDYENDEAMKVLRLFYDIWGVGAKTAREFYYTNHWTELDDIIEFGWNDLDRVQQIGLKYYEEFLVRIPRAEVEQIASVVRKSAERLRDKRITVTIVGGYRRGKEASGDVDMIVSHPDAQATVGLVQEIVEALEDEQWITHTLTMNLTNTNRGQQTLPFRSARPTGVGFDTLDKALVVWQDPAWPSRDQDLAENPDAKNPNIHRRVDIIVSPWRTLGCAITGWSGGTTFQRDLRRYAKYAKGWKFDSSGVRSRSNGEVVELEGPNGVEGTPEDAEKTVFRGLGLEFIPPEYRVTY